MTITSKVNERVIRKIIWKRSSSIIKRFVKHILKERSLLISANFLCKGRLWLLPVTSSTTRECLRAHMKVYLNFSHYSIFITYLKNLGVAQYVETDTIAEIVLLKNRRTKILNMKS
jgi:hypothetical protein